MIGWMQAAWQGSQGLARHSLQRHVSIRNKYERTANTSSKTAPQGQRGDHLRAQRRPAQWRGAVPWAAGVERSWVAEWETISSPSQPLFELSYLGLGVVGAQGKAALALEPRAPLAGQALVGVCLQQSSDKCTR
jgi:hypothetical protein